MRGVAKRLVTIPGFTESLRDTAEKSAKGRGYGRVLTRGWEGYTAGKRWTEYCWAAVKDQSN